MVALEQPGSTRDALLAAALVRYLAAFEDTHPWHADAACREHPELSWFPEKGARNDAAKAVCARCLVRVECREYAASAGEGHGIWSGESARSAGFSGNVQRVRGPAPGVHRRPARDEEVE